MDSLRIASLVPSLTETLFGLGLGASVVARTGFCIHPREDVRRVPKVGGTKDVDIQALLATVPTHVVVNIDENRAEILQAIFPHIPEIIVTHPMAPDDNLALYRNFGRLFDCKSKAAAIESGFMASRDALATTTSGRPVLKVLYLIWKDPWFTVSPPTYVASMLSLANLQTVPATAAARYPKLSNDDPAWREADVILLSTEPYAFRERHVAELSRALPSPKPILLVDGELISWYGVRAIAGLNYMAEVRARIDAVN